MDCYLTMEIHDVLIYTTIWINFEDIMQNEINQ